MTENYLVRRSRWDDESFGSYDRQGVSAAS